MPKNNELPSDFFSSPGLDETWAFLRTQVLESLREENHTQENTLDLMMLERTSHLYGAIRQLEARTDDEGKAVPYLGANYAKMMDMLVKMLESLRNQRDSDFIIEEARAEVMHAMAIGLKDSLKEIPAEQRKKIMENLRAYMTQV